MEIVGFSDHKSTAAIWYRLLNLGFRIPAGAGTDAMANYADLRGPVGMNRVFLDTSGDDSPAAALNALKAGKTFASNGPLLGLEIEGKHPGAVIQPTAGGTLHYRVALRSPVPVEHLEIVANGKVLKAFDLTGNRQVFDAEGDIDTGNSSWLVLRAWNRGSDPEVLDIYPYATTSPIYLELSSGRPEDPEDAAYFVSWLDRVIADASARTDYRTPGERGWVLDYLRKARERYAAIAR
jgi:hypothetical protein